MSDFNGVVYFGGKKRLAPWIVSHFPNNYQNLHYVEPFFGGGAVFFEKERSKIETINDLDKSIFLLYDQIQKNPVKLKERLDSILYHELENKKGREMLKNLDGHSDLDIAAYKLFVLYSSFSGKGCSFGVTKSRNKASGDKNKNYRNLTGSFFKICGKVPLMHDYLKSVQILNRDGLEVIKRFDNEDVLFYLDPPYPETEQGGYKNSFQKEQFNQLLNLLKETNAKFLLSCYKKDWMKFDKSWNVYFKNISLNVGNASDGDRERVECLITNFKNEEKQHGLL